MGAKRFTIIIFPTPCWNFRRALNSFKVLTIWLLLSFLAFSPVTHGCFSATSVVKRSTGS